ncbi:sensor histidine kinase [Enterococcus sp. LJL99]
MAIKLMVYYLSNILPLWLIFCAYFYNFYTALDIKTKRWKLLLSAGLLCLWNCFCVFILGSFVIEKISFILIILFIVSPMIWRKSNLFFFKIVSTCLLLTGLHLSFTIFSDIVNMIVLNQMGLTFYDLQTLEQTLILSFCAYGTQVCLCLLLNHFLRSKRGRRIMQHLFQTTTVSWVTFLSAVSMTGILIGYFLNYYTILFKQMNLVVFLFAVYALFGLIFGVTLAFLSYLRLYQERLKATETMLIQQQSYNKVLEDIQQDIRHFQHDYKNILSSFYLQLKEGNIEAAQALLEEKFLSFDKNVSYNIKQLGFLNNIQVIEVKSLLLTKMLQMEQRKIKFQVEILDSISTFNIDTEDLVRCLGILLDNAMEEEAATKERTVYFLAYCEDSTVTILVKNHLTEQKEVTKLLKEGYSTKGENRGVGLSSYQKILSKYPNVLNKTVISDNQFQQVLKMQIN